MKNKKFISWGVSFSSLALVAGMISYLGVTNKNTASKTNPTVQAPTTAQSSVQPAISQSSSQNQTFTSQPGSFNTTTGGS